MRLPALAPAHNPPAVASAARPGEEKCQPNDPNAHIDPTITDAVPEALF